MSGRRFAYGGVGVGLSISIAANVMHALRPGAQWWAPGLSGAWPLLLFLALEVLMRNVWSGRALLVARVGLAVVAVVAAALSYWHLRALLLVASEDSWAATIGPLAIDGLMAVSAAALLAGDVPEHVAPTVDVDESNPQPRVEGSTDSQPQVEGSTDSQPQVESSASRRSRPAAGRPPVDRHKTGASDEQLLTRLDELVKANELAPDAVTGHRVRILLKVGAERSTRLAAAWQGRCRLHAVGEREAS